jgi:hypothetical protein
LAAFFALVLTLGLSGCDADGGDQDKPVEPAVVIPNPGDTVVEIAAPGDPEEWKPPVDGYYLIELWGSQGWSPTDDAGNQYGGKGAYVRGIMEITPTEVAAGQTLYVSVGIGTNPAREGYGGGASDVRWGEDTLYSRIIVAAGGGGSHDKSLTDQTNGWDVSGQRYSTGGYGGELTGGNSSGGKANTHGKGGTQTAGGEGGDVDNHQGASGEFGTGGYASSRPIGSTDSVNNVGESWGSDGSGYWGGGAELAA